MRDPRPRTRSNSSGETPTCVTSLKRRSRKISQQMLALLSSHSIGKDEDEDEDDDQEERKVFGRGHHRIICPSPMASSSRGTLTTMTTVTTTSGLPRTTPTPDRSNAGEFLDYYDAQRERERDPRYPPQLPSAGYRSNPNAPRQGKGHTPHSSYSSTKYSREAPKQPATSATSPTKPMGPRPPSAGAGTGAAGASVPAARTTDDRSQRRPPYAHGNGNNNGNNNSGNTSRDALDNRRGPLLELDFFSGGLSPHSSLQNLPQPSSAPPTNTNRYPPEPQGNSIHARRGLDRNTRPAIVASQASQPAPVPTTPASAPAYSTSIRPHTPHRTKNTADRGTTPPGRFPASPPQASSQHNRALSDPVADGSSPHIERRRTHARPGTGGTASSVRPRSPRDAGIVRGTPHRTEHVRNASSGSDYSDSGKYDHPKPQPQQQHQQGSSSTPVAQVSRDQTSFDMRVDMEKAKPNWQAGDLSIADLWTSAVNAAEKEHQDQLLQKSNGPLSANSITSATSQMGSSNVPTSESSPSPSGMPSYPHSSLSFGRPGSRGGRENQPHPPPAAPAIVHNNSGSSYNHNHNHIALSIPPVPSSLAGPLPSHIDVMPISPPPRRPARPVAQGSVSVAPPSASASVPGSTSSIAPKRPLGSTELSPHKSHAQPSPTRPPPPSLPRSPTPPKSPPPPAVPAPPAKSVPAPREASSQSSIKPPVPRPLSPALNNTKPLSVFAARGSRGSASPVKPHAPLPPTIPSKSAPAPAPASAAPAPASPVKPPVTLPDPITKSRAILPPSPPVKPPQLRPKNNNDSNSPLPPPPMQLPSVPPPAPGKENNRGSAKTVALPPHSRGRLSDYSIVAVSVKSGSAEEDEAADNDEVQVEVQRLQAVDRGEEHAESSESEYSGSESQCVSVPCVHDPRIKPTDKPSLHRSVSVSASDSESKVTSSTVAVAPPPAPKLQPGDKTADASTGSLHIREAAESAFRHMHRVEQPEVTTPTMVAGVIEGLDTTPTPGNLAGVGAKNRVKVEPPAPAPASAPSRRKGEVAHPSPPKLQLLDGPTMDLRPISLGFLESDDAIFHFSDPGQSRLTSDRTNGTPQRAYNDRKGARPPPRVSPPKRSTSGKRPPVAVTGGHARRKGNMSSSGSEYEDDTHEHRFHPKAEMKMPSQDFGNPFATPAPSTSTSSRPGTATTTNTATTSSVSATGHGSLPMREPRPWKRSTRPDWRTTIVPKVVDESNLGHGVEGDVEDTDDDDDEDDDFEVETEHGRVLRKVKEKNSWPSAMSFRDVISEPTTVARARGYATKINELSKEDCGLKDWIEVWLKPKLLAGQLDIQPSAHARVASGASVFSATTFPMRPDAFRAIDLTPGAGGGPTELGNDPPPLPYPSLAMKQLQQGSSFRFKSNANSSNMLLPTAKKSAGFFSSLGRKASARSKAAGDSSGQENRERERVRRKLYRAPPSGSSTSQLGHFSDIGHSSSKASLVPLAPSIVGGPRAPPGKPKRASTVLVIGPPQLIHPPPPAQYPPNMVSKPPSVDAFISAAASSSSTVAPHQPMTFQTNIVPPAPEGPRPVTRTPSFPGHSSSSSSLSRGYGLAPPDANVNGSGGKGPEKRSKLRQAVSYQPPRQSSDDGYFEKSLDKLCDTFPGLERELLAGYLRQAGGQEMVTIGRIIDDQKRGAIARP